MGPARLRLPLLASLSAVPGFSGCTCVHTTPALDPKHILNLVHAGAMLHLWPGMAEQREPGAPWGNRGPVVAPPPQRGSLPF